MAISRYQGILDVHEMSIAKSILDIIIPVAEKEGANKITSVNVLAGELRGLVPLQLTFCFGLMAENTIASGANLNLEISPIKGKCRRCNEVFLVRDYLYICPKCQSPDVYIIGGSELKVMDIVVA